MTVTSLFQYSFAFDDFIFGGDNSPYQIMTINGLEDLPDIRNQDDNRGYQDGMWTGRDFLSGRTITMSITVRGDVNNSMSTNLYSLQAALQPQQQGTKVLQFQMPNAPLQRVNARVRRRAVTVDTSYSSGLATLVYEFFCPDPLIYEDTNNTQNIYSAIGETGRIYNRIYNMLYGGGSGNNQLITNDGWATTYPVITITGPALNPKISDITSGAFLLLNYNMVISDTIVIDTNLRSVTLNGVNQRSILDNSSTWFALPSGTSVYQFRATSNTGTGTSCIVSWRNAYI